MSFNADRRRGEGSGEDHSDQEVSEQEAAMRGNLSGETPGDADFVDPNSSNSASGEQDLDQIFGTFGRTERDTVVLTRRSGERFAAEVYRCINVAQDPQLREALLADELYEVADPAGGAPYRLAFPIRYHDPEAAIFALILPEALRHQESTHRAELLDDLVRAGELVADYMHEFYVLFGAQSLPELERHVIEDALAADGGAFLDELAEDSAAQFEDSGIVDGQPNNAQVAGSAEGHVDEQADEPLASDDESLEVADSDPGNAEELAADELAIAWGRVEQERERLLLERGQLDEVRARIDRERAQMDEVEMRIVAERAEIAELRQALQVRELNVEQKEMQLEHGLAQPSSAESTQVVTDDQFIAVFQSEAEDLAVEDDLSAALYGDPSEPTGMLPSPYSMEALSVPTETSVTRVDAVGVVRELDPSEPDRIILGEGRILATIRVDRETLDELEQADDLSFFAQGVFLGLFDEPLQNSADQASDPSSQDETYPFIGLLLAALDEDGTPRASVGWALNPVDSQDDAVLARLAQHTAFHAALYDETGQLSAVYEILAPIRENITWLRERVAERLDELPADSATRHPGAFRAAADRWLEPGAALFGRLRHNFKTDSFVESVTPSQVSLAASIVGFWSDGDRPDYLIANRSFPLVQFDAIQKRVVRRAVQHGIFINEPLRAIALEMGLAPSEEELAERLVTEFAETSVGLRQNDLDPLAEWENWDELLGLAEDLSTNLDAEILELAEASLKRAQEFQEAETARAASESEESSPADDQALGDDEVDDEVDHSEIDMDPIFSVDSLLVARRSETTGVTYFLPDDALIDTFDDLSEMSYEDLELLLEDPAGRLEAAQMLMERFEEEGVAAALNASEEMTATEVAALARFAETKALEVESTLVESLKEAGPSATYIATRALAGMRSGAATPALLAAYRDPARRGNTEQLARALSRYGDALIPDLRRSIQADGHDDTILMLIHELDQVEPGILAKLAMDSSKKVRKAANAARKRTI